MFHRASFGRFRYDGVRRTIEADNQQADSGGIASSSDITHENIGDELDELGGIKTKAVPMTRTMSSDRLAITEQQHVGSMRTHEATVRSQQDDYTRFKDSTYGYVYMLAEVPRARKYFQTWTRFSACREPEESAPRLDLDDLVRSGGFCRRNKRMLPRILHGGNTNGSSDKRLNSGNDPSLQEKTTRRTTLHHARCSGRSSMAETKAITIVDQS